MTANGDKDIALAAVLFTAIGVGYLFPFSALTQPVDYWHKIFPDFNIEFPLTTLYMWVNLVFLFIIVFFGGKPSYTFRIVGGFAGQLLVLVAVPSFYFMNFDESTHFYMIMAGTSIAAITTALIDSVAIGLAAQFPTRVQEALQFGIGFSTFIGSFYRVLTKLVFPVKEVVASSLLYFYCGAFTIVLCIAAYYKLLTLQLSKECIKFGSDSEQTTKSELELMESRPQSNLNGGTNERTALLSKNVPANENSEADIDKWALLKKVWFGECVVFVLFLSTLLLWPPLITEIKSYDFPYLQESQWWPLILLFIFALLDCVGRLCLSFRFGLTADNIWIAVLIRFGLFPLIICSVKGIYFTHDFWSVLFVSLLGFTNGYLGSLAILFVTESVLEKERGVVGMITGFFLNAGLVVGATLACYFEQLVL